MEKIIALSICFVIASFSSCTAYTNYDDNKTMKDMVKNGAEPVAARCAVKGSATGVCEILASKVAP